MHLPHRYYDLDAKRMALGSAAEMQAQMMAPLGMMSPSNPTVVTGTWSLLHQYDNANGTATTNTFTITITSSTAHSLLTLAFVNSFNSLITVVSVTDSASQTWVLDNQENDDATIADEEIWSFPNTVAGVTTVTVTVSVGQLATHCAYNVGEWSSTRGAAGGVLDGHPAGTTGTSTTALAPSVTPSGGTSNELFIAIVGTQSASLTGSAGGGFTGLTWADPAGANNTRAGYLIATDALTHQMSWGLTGSDNYAGTAASFKP